ncbi:MAG TPA: hypothetical protein VFY54_12625 [Rubrobacter sp.]|nr:hypothetical protein [Rubrobacter sp.]
MGFGDRDVFAANPPGQSVTELQQDESWGQELGITVSADLENSLGLISQVDFQRHVRVHHQADR